MESFKSAGGIYHLLCWDNNKYSNSNLTLVEVLDKGKCSNIITNKPRQEIIERLNSIEDDFLIKSPCENCSKKCHRVRDGHTPISEEELDMIKESLRQENQEINADIFDQDGLIGQLVEENEF